MVKRDGLVDKLRITADGRGVVAHAGSALLAGTADRIGLTRALPDAMAPMRQRASAHDPGVVLRDLVVMLADGGDCLADLGALRDQVELFGAVASDSTAFRVIDSIDAAGLEGLRSFVWMDRSRPSVRVDGARDYQGYGGPQRGVEVQGLLGVSVRARTTAPTRVCGCRGSLR